jgi:hypothetical protein
MSSSTAALSLPRALQVEGSVEGGGGGTLTLEYSSNVDSVAGKTSTADTAGTGSVMGMGFGSIRGPNGMAAAGGYGGGNIEGGFSLTAFNGASGNAIGGGQLGGFGGGVGQFVPGQNSNGLTGSTGGAGGALAFALGLGAANLTAPGAGEFAAANATGKSDAFGGGYGLGSNSQGIAGGNAVSEAAAEGGGAGEAGMAPVEGVPSTMLGGNTNFIGIGQASALNTGSGFFGNMVDVNQPIVPFVSGFAFPTFSFASP